MRHLLLHCASGSCRDVTFTTITDPNATGHRTDQMDINNLGQIVGAYGDDLSSHGFLYSGGTFTTIDVPGSRGTSADHHALQPSACPEAARAPCAAGSLRLLCTLVFAMICWPSLLEAKSQNYAGRLAPTTAEECVRAGGDWHTTDECTADRNTVSVLNKLSEYWKTRAPLCGSKKVRPFPTKCTEKDPDCPPPDPKLDNCNDGDAPMINGLLCSVGNKMGCETIARSQDKDGRWWRSPAKIGAPEGSESSFSKNHALGVWLYLAETRNGKAFNRWINWMDKHRYRGLPAYCPNNECIILEDDCRLLDRLAFILNQPNQPCDIQHASYLMLIDSLNQLEQQSNDLISNVNKIPVMKVFTWPLQTSIRK